MNITKSLITAFCCGFALCAWASPEKKPAENLGFLNVGVRVQDTQENPIEGADISVHFHTVHPDHGGFYLKQSGKSVTGESVRFKERALDTLTVVTKEEHWKSVLVDEWPDSIDKSIGWYFPETRKDIIIVLRKKQNPRPLFAQRTGAIFLREFDVPYGYDLEIGDWVRPHGKGTRADMIFTMSGAVNKETDEYDVTTTLSFPNKGDGVIAVRPVMLAESKLLLGQEAPLEGYQPTFEMRSKHKRPPPGEDEASAWARIYGKNPDDPPPLEGLWFRTHTEIDPETGNVLRARYGKVYSTNTVPIISYFILEKPRWEMGFHLEFTYFYAPDHSRSVEFNGTTLVPNGNLQGVDKH